jgi:hypothetical protein
MFPPPPASVMTAGDIRAELASLEIEWHNFRSECEGHGGSPGEWFYERMDELTTELKRRDPDFEP